MDKTELSQREIEYFKMRIYGLSPGETTWLINDENTKFLRVPGGWANANLHL